MTRTNSNYAEELTSLWMCKRSIALISSNSNQFVLICTLCCCAISLCSCVLKMVQMKLLYLNFSVPIYVLNSLTETCSINSYRKKTLWIMQSIMSHGVTSNTIYLLHFLQETFVWDVSLLLWSWIPSTFIYRHLIYTL